MTKDSPTTKWIALIATGLAGTIAGSMAFVSAVDVRSFQKHTKDPKNEEVIISHFKIWWPCGRDFMVPLIFSAALANVAAWYSTKDRSWAAAALTLFSIAPYTRLALMEDIDTLRASSSKEVNEATSRFCFRHHARLILGMVGFGLSLSGLMNFGKK